MVIRVASYGLSLVTPPAAEPVTTAEAKKQLEIAAGITYHDAHLDRLIKAARIRTEELTNRQWITATWDLLLDRFPAGNGKILIPRAPLVSVGSVSYLDASGSTQVLSASVYKVTTSREPGEISLKYGQTWPVTRDEADAVTVRFTAGYGASSTSVPELARHLILLLVASAFHNRSGEDAAGFRSGLPVGRAHVSREIRDLLDALSYGDEHLCFGH